MFRLPFTLALLALCLSAPSFAANYYVDPEKGAPDGDGSSAKPWKTLEEVSKGPLKSLKGGDTLLLRNGYHGDVKFGGDNESLITIAADKGQRPTLSRLTITGGSNWLVKGLIVSPSFAETGYKGNIVTFGENGESTKISIEDCYIFTAEDASSWDAQQWMNANNGILMGRNGRDLTVRNNFLRNVRFGISLTSFDSLCEGNVVSDFSGDAIRATRDGLVVKHNIIKNIYVSASDGDDNHDDGIQTFLFNKGTGLMKNVKMIGNIIIAHENADQKFKNSLQGIGCFDGPLQDFVVTDNVVNVDSHHGISLYDAQNAKVERNVVWTAPSGKVRAWIMFGSKPKVNAAHDNVARDNFAGKFNLKAAGTTDEENEPITEAIYHEALVKRYKEITEKFGEKHFAADRVRMQIK